MRPLAQAAGKHGALRQGPFYFGDSPTYVDFLLCCVMDWTEETVLTAIKAAPFAACPKISGVVDGIRGLDSHRASARLDDASSFSRQVDTRAHTMLMYRISLSLFLLPSMLVDSHTLFLLQADYNGGLTTTVPQHCVDEDFVAAYKCYRGALPLAANQSTDTYCIV